MREASSCSARQERAQARRQPSADELDPLEGPEVTGETWRPGAGFREGPHATTTWPVGVSVSGLRLEGLCPFCPMWWLLVVVTDQVPKYHHPFYIPAVFLPFGEGVRTRAGPEVGYVFDQTTNNLEPAKRASREASSHSGESTDASPSRSPDTEAHAEASAVRDGEALSQSADADVGAGL